MQTEQRTTKEENDTAPRRERRGRNFEAGVRVHNEPVQSFGGFPPTAWGSPYGPAPQFASQAYPGFGQGNVGTQGYGPGHGFPQQGQPFGAMAFPNPFAAIGPTLSYGLAGLADLVYRGVSLATAQGQSLLGTLQGPQSWMGSGPAPVAWPQARLPATDIVDEGSEIVCQVELPGVKPENVDVACHGRGILVTAQAEPEIDLGALVQAERGLQATYRRAIALPVQVQPSGAKARLRDGILTINVPKADPTEGPRRVTVE